MRVPFAVSENVGVGARAFTVTVIVAVAVPLVFVAVIVYVVVVDGDTEVDPLVLTDPMPLSMLTDAAPVVVQVSVDEEPIQTVDGVAVKLSTVGGRTVTVTLAVASVKPSADAVNVYVVVDVGLTVAVPLVFDAVLNSEPTPLSIDADVPIALHESVTDAPRTTEVDDAPSEADGDGPTSRHVGFGLPAVLSI